MSEKEDRIILYTDLYKSLNEFMSLYKHPYITMTVIIGHFKAELFEIYPTGVKSITHYYSDGTVKTISGENNPFKNL